MRFLHLGWLYGMRLPLSLCVFGLMTSFTECPWTSFTLRRARCARERRRWHGRAWIFTNNASGLWWRRRKGCSLSVLYVLSLGYLVPQGIYGYGAMSRRASGASVSRAASRPPAQAEPLAGHTTRRPQRRSSPPRAS